MTVKICYVSALEVSVPIQSKWQKKRNELYHTKWLWHDERKVNPKIVERMREKKVKTQKVRSDGQTTK